MKYIISIIITFSFFNNITAQSGIEFFKGDWEKTIKEANKENKLIFVYAYTTWCGPCIWMSNNVFPEEAVGDFYNENFINVKLDMEKGEGILFAKAYNVNAYPTLLFINGNGDMVHTGLGGRSPGEFIELGEAAIDPKRQVGSLQRKYNAGYKEPAFLKTFAEALSGGGLQGSSNIAQEYLSSQEDWTTDENMEFIFNMANYQNMEDPLFQEVVKNKEAYRNLVGKEQVDYGLKAAPSIKAANIPGINRQQIEAIFHQVFPENYKQYADEFEMNALYGTDGYVQAAVDYLGKYNIENSNQLNEIAWAVYELSSDKKVLKLAKQWTEKSIKLNGNYMNYDTLAAICYKLNDKKEALKHANTAIEMAKSEGHDASSTEELLEKIKSK